MKNAQMVSKITRGLLICAMAFVLSGVTLNKVFASYSSYAQIKVEHIWQDNGNVDENGNWDSTQNAGLSKPAEDQKQENLIEQIEHSYTDESLKESLESITITAGMSGDDIGTQVNEKLKDAVVSEVVTKLQEQLGLLKELKELVPAGDNAADKFEKLSSQMKDKVVEKLVELLGNEGIFRDHMDADFLTELNSSISFDDINEKLNDVFSYPEKYYKGPAGDDGDGEGDGDDEPVVDGKTLETITAELTAQLETIDLGDKLNNETVEGIVTSVIQEIAERANKDKDNVKDMDLQLGKLDVVNAQSSGWVSIEDLQTSANILKMSDDSETMLKEQGYETSLRIEIIVVEQHAENRNWAKEETYQKTYYSTDNGKTWILQAYVDKDGKELSTTDEAGNPIKLDAAEVVGDGEGVSQYLYTYLHVRTPDPVSPPPPGDNPPPPPGDNPPPEEDIPEPETPLEEPPEEPEPDEEIDEPDIPLSDIPETGDISDLWYGAALVLAAGLAILLYQERRSKKTA